MSDRINVGSDSEEISSQDDQEEDDIYSDHFEQVSISYHIDLSCFFQEIPIYCYLLEWSRKQRWWTEICWKSKEDEEWTVQASQNAAIAYFSKAVKF